MNRPPRKGHGGLPDGWWTWVSPVYDRAVAVVGWHRGLDALADGVDAGRVLEIGCGPAYLARRLANRGVDYVGADRNAAMLARAHAAVTPGRGRCVFVRAEVTALPFATRSFDCVLAAGVLGLLDVASRQAALREAARVTDGEVRLLEPVHRPGAPVHRTRAHLIGLVRDQPLELAELVEAGLEPELRGPPLLAGVYSMVHAAKM